MISGTVRYALAHSTPKLPLALRTAPTAAAEEGGDEVQSNKLLPLSLPNHVCKINSHQINSWSNSVLSLEFLVPWGITHLFLIVNVIAMCVCSTLVIARKRTEYAVAGLLGVVITQGLGYGLIFDLNFFLRNLSVVGGLLMVISDSWVRKKFVPAGLPQLDEKDRKMYVQFAGRVLLIFLFIGFVFSGAWSFWRVIVSLFGLVACVMVIVGFKAKWSAIILVVLLSIFNILVNNFWTV